MKRTAVLAAALAAWAGGAEAQVERNTPARQTTVDTALYGTLKYRNIGPNRGGRSIAVAGSTARPLEYYFGATGGGLWKSTDAGQTWSPVTDGQLGSSSVGAVAVCEANPDVVYIGTGEAQLRGNILPGDGVYRSTDAGKTWKHIGLREAHNIARIRVHPTDCNTVWTAALGHYGAPNPERGVFKSTDGGATWRKVLFRNDSTGAVDLSVHPTDPNLLFASLWEAWRKPWGMSSGGPGSGLFKSTDGGSSWSEVSRAPGMPAGLLGKIGVDVSPVDASRVYAIVEADSGGVFVSDDAGQSWRRANTERKLRQRAFYYTRIKADPQQKDRVYVLNVQFWRSDDGGSTFPTELEVPHSDNHDLWIALDDNKRMVQGNDGGGTVSVNGGETWTDEDYPTAQLYRVHLTSHTPYFACGGQQDNSTICVPGKGWEHLLAGGINGAAGAGDFGYSVGGCESGYVAQSPRDPNVYFSGCYGGSLDRYDHSNGQSRAVNVWPENPMGYPSGEIRERAQWTFPIVFDPQEPNTLYTTTQHVWRSTSEGQSWERISPDLTRHDPATLGSSGGPITRDQTGVETYATVFALQPSRLEAEVIWAASDDGLVHLTRDNGRTWQNVTPAGLPDFVKWTTVEDSPHRPGVAWITGHRFLLDDFAPYVYRTEDYGRTWARIAAGLPADEITRSVREDPRRPGLVYLGTERGVWVSWDGGDRWQRLQQNLPVAQVADLAVRDNDLVVATHGRSFWVLDNIDALRQLPELGNRTTFLFQPAPAVRGVDQGVVVDYYLRSPARSVTLDFLDEQGRLVRSFTGSPADTARRGGPGAQGGARPAAPPRPAVKAGMNRFTWDLRYPGFTDFPGMILWAARNVGPRALPGRYQVRLTVDGRPVQTRAFEVRLDPRVRGVSPEDLQRRFQLATQIRDRVTQANDAVLLVRGIARQVSDRVEKSDDAQLDQALQGFAARLSEVENVIYNTRLQSSQDPLNYPIRLNNKLAALMGEVEGAEAAPTEQAQAVFQLLSRQLDEQLARLERILAEELPRLNEQLRARRLDPLARTPLRPTEESAASPTAGGEAEQEPRRW